MHSVEGIHDFVPDMFIGEVARVISNFVLQHSIGALGQSDGVGGVAMLEKTKAYN